MSLSEKVQIIVACIAFAAMLNGILSYAGARRGRRDGAVKLEAQHAALLKDTTKRLDDHLEWADSQRSTVQGHIEEVKEKIVGMDSGIRHLTDSMTRLVDKLDRTDERMNTLIGEFQAYRDSRSRT